MEQGSDETLSAGTIIPGLRLEYDPTGTIELDFATSANIGVPDPNESFYHALGVLSFDITKAWEFEISAAWDHVQSPKPDADGVLPAKNDVRTTFGVSVEY